MNEYEYIDTAPTSNDISLNYNMFYGQPQSDLEVAGLKVAPYGRGNGLEVTPILREAEPKTYQWSEPILNNNDYGWSEPRESWSEPKDVWVSPKVINIFIKMRKPITFVIKNVLSDTFQQDYSDIDYTSGGLVTFHSSLS